jgi:hypothetical protein
MRISSEHANQQTVRFSDFSGGLNTTDAPESIAENELSRSINVEIYNGQLKTVAGDRAVYKSSDISFNNIIYDAIESKMLLTDTDRNVYLLEDGTLTSKGTLTGKSEVQYAAWEDGVLIASGGKLQYYHGGMLETIANAPDVCRGAFIKQGRVWTFYDDVLKCSAIGDETAWTNDSNDSSSSQWLQVGYKDGGKIVGVCSLSSDILIFKDNHHAYHLAGAFPNWTLSEIGRQIDCKSYHACVALGNSTLALGRAKMQAVSVTDDYGDMMARDISQKIYRDIISLPTVRLRYLPSLNQVWLLGGTRSFLFLDANTGGWFTRKYNDYVMDAVEADGSIYFLKHDGLYVLDASLQSDDGNTMLWRFKPKTLVSDNNYLIKRVRIDTTPFHVSYASEALYVGRVRLSITQPESAECIYENSGTIYNSELGVLAIQSRALETNTEEVYLSPEELLDSELPLVLQSTYRSETRCVDREKSIHTSAYGSGGVTVFNSIAFDIVEV